MTAAFSQYANGSAIDHINTFASMMTMIASQSAADLKEVSTLFIGGAVANADQCINAEAKLCVTNNFINRTSINVAAMRGMIINRLIDMSWVNQQCKWSIKVTLRLTPAVVLQNLPLILFHGNAFQISQRSR